MVDFNRLIKIIIPILIGIGLLFFPLIGDFHFESALLVSLVGCFWAGIRACKSPSEQNDFWDALQVAGYLFLVGLPLLLNAIFTGCFSTDGLAFWLLFLLPSVFFGYAIGRMLRIWDWPYRKLTVCLVLAFVALGIFLYELLTYPQVYFFNHVWGAWPGPIYDEEVRMGSAAVFFRGLTILWTLFFWNMPTVNTDSLSKWVVGFAAIAISLAYTQSAEFGIISPRAHLQQALAGYQKTEHFELYYDKRLYNSHEITQLAAEHEFYYDQVSRQLDLSGSDSTNKIESYLYGHPWQKKQLVGAKFTSYVPVWLDQDQLHIAKQQISGSLRHELVHVMAKQFGNKLFNASWSIGLIEGLAVAVDGGSSSSTTVDQLVVSEKPYPNANELQHAFSPWGFYGGRSGVNYNTSGSFVRFLMDSYPIAKLKEAYRTGDVANAYSVDWQTLTSEWHQHLDSVQVDSTDQRVANRIFGIPSLFEKPCPHTVSDFARAYDKYRFHLADRDSANSLEFLGRALTASDSLPSIKAEWSYRQLVHGNISKVQQAASLADSTANLQLLYADAFALNDKRQRAQEHLQQAQELYRANPDSVLAPAMATRMNQQQWNIYRQLTYRNVLPDSTAFADAYYRTKIRSLQKGLHQQRWRRIELYSRQLMTAPLHLRYFDEYQSLVHHLAFHKRFAMAKTFIERLSALSLRQRHKKRLQQEKDWITFLESRAGYSHSN
jgi:hypothetical protein